MLSFFLEEVGALDADSQVLSVGAGREAIAFWLAPHVGRLVATDTYGSGDFAGSEAPDTMLSAPESLSPYEHALDHLEVRPGDARELGAFDDGSFDAVYSLSSIEHFGTPEDIARAAAEIGRVLRPGGHAYLATELQVRPAPAPSRAFDAAFRAVSGGRWRRREVFTEATLERDVIDPSGLELMEPLDTSLSPESFDNLAVRRFGRWLHTPTGRFHPHIALRVRGETFTSVGLPLRKP
jgi:SAM-dependent methyltransferase